jgi:DNA-binding transcriptional regulator YiaG
MKVRKLLPKDVKMLREKAGLSIAQAARCVQIAERSWQRYESGDREIPPGLVELFCLKNGIKYQPK